MCKCQLYVFRMAVYYAEHKTHEKQKLKCIGNIKDIIMKKRGDKMRNLIK